jgi:septum formation protein
MVSNGDCEIYLASASPRRRELLHQVGIRFHVITGLDVEERRLANETAVDFATRVACDKARAGLDWIRNNGLPARPVLGADTCIEIDGEILGKPADREDAFTILRRLSGRTHNVLSSICLVDGSPGNTRILSDINCSRVTFKNLTDEEIEQYWNTGEPVDKAGAYAIQGIAAKFVTELQGSFSGVVGLPLYELTCLLQQVAEDVLHK